MGRLARLSIIRLAGFLELSLKGVLGAVAGLGEIAVGTVLHGVWVAVSKLIFHGVVAGLGPFVGLLRTFPAVGIIQKMVAGAFRHDSLSKVRALIKMITGLGYAESSRRATSVCMSVCTRKLLK